MMYKTPTEITKNVRQQELEFILAELQRIDDDLEELGRYLVTLINKDPSIIKDLRSLTAGRVSRDYWHHLERIGRGLCDSRLHRATTPQYAKLVRCDKSVQTDVLDNKVKLLDFDKEGKITERKVPIEEVPTELLTELFDTSKPVSTIRTVTGQYQERQKRLRKQKAAADRRAKAHKANKGKLTPQKPSKIEIKGTKDGNVIVTIDGKVMKTRAFKEVLLETM